MSTSKAKAEAKAVLRKQPQQLKELAFSLYGWAIEDKLLDRPVRDLVTAREASGTRYTTIISKAERKATPASSTFSDPSSRSAAEDVPPDYSRHGTRLYLVVGYAPREPVDRFADNHVYGGKENRAVGTRRLYNTKAWDDDSPPVLVIAPLWCESSCMLYALLNPVEGLCTPHFIQRERVFFRWEYRSTTAMTERKLHWPRLVRYGVRRVNAAGKNNLAALKESNVNNDEEDGQASSAEGDGSEGDEVLASKDESENEDEAQSESATEIPDGENENSGHQHTLPTGLQNENVPSGTHNMAPFAGGSSASGPTPLDNNNVSTIHHERTLVIKPKAHTVPQKPQPKLGTKSTDISGGTTQPEIEASAASEPTNPVRSKPLTSEWMKLAGEMQQLACQQQQSLKQERDQLSADNALLRDELKDLERIVEIEKSQSSDWQIRLQAREAALDKQVAELTDDRKKLTDSQAELAETRARLLQLQSNLQEEKSENYKRRVQITKDRDQVVKDKEQLKQETTKFTDMIKSVSDMSQRMKRAQESDGEEGPERKVKKQRDA